MIGIKTLNSISPVYRDVLDMNEYTVGDAVENADAILVRSFNMHEFEPDKTVKCVARAGAGTNNIPVDAYAEKGIVVFNTPGANANAVKELTIAAILLASRKIVNGIEWAQTLKGADGDVAKLVEKGKNQFVGPELSGKKLGVIGLGEIGVKVANAGIALEMQVYGYDPYISVEHAWMLSRSVKHVNTLDEILKNCDYITVHVPLTDATRNTINAEALAAMKPNCALINMARGELCDTDAVLAALGSGALRVYATDFPNEKLLGCDKVIAIPHLGASTPESEDNCVEMASREIDAFLKTGAITHSVNFPAIDPGAVAMPRLVLLHGNVPNMVGSITSALARCGLNIENMANKSRGNHAVTVIDVGDAPDEALCVELAAIANMYSVRMILPE